MRVALLKSGPLREALALAGGAAAQFGPAAGQAARAISGIGISYRAPAGSHRLAGHRAPDIPLVGGRSPRLYEALRGGSFVLLTAADAPSLLSRWPGRVRLEVPGPVLSRMILVRPDGYIAWATDDQDPARRDAALHRALTQWCGAPAGQVAAYGRS